MRLVLLILLALASSPAPASADGYTAADHRAELCRAHLNQIGWTRDGTPYPWQCKEHVARSLKAAIAVDSEFRRQTNDPGESSRIKTIAGCAPLERLGHGCGYDMRSLLVEFLDVYGKNPFPTDSPDPTYVGTAYIGKDSQNAALGKAIERNAKLFADGDLTAAEAARWR